MTADEVATRIRSQHRPRSIAASASRSLRLTNLEPRLLFSATPIDPAVMSGDDAAVVMQVETSSDQNTAAQSDEDASVQTIAEPAQQSGHEIILIDSSVPELQALLDDLDESRPNAEVYVLQGDRDGIDQITEILDGRSGVQSLHLVSHAEDGAVKLGQTWLGQSNLDGYAGSIASWQSALASDADVLLYGCDLASSEDGRTLVDSIGALTGADVAASTNDTGNAEFDADWQFEYHTGQVDTQVAFSEQFQDAWLHKLASLTINVDTFSDVVDGGDAFTSLREAIIQANANAGGDTTINLLAGTYTRSLNAAGEENAASGDLDIREDVTIVGAGAGLTIIDAGYNDRVFDVHDGHLTMSDLTVTAGVASGGGGAVNVGDSAANLTLNRVILTDNGASEGAAIASAGTINLTDVEISNNGGSVSTIKGGGIYNDGTAVLNRVTLSGNAADAGGAIYNDASSSLSLTNVTISGNTAASSGGAIYNKNSGFSVVNSTITLNSADTAGGIYTNGSPRPTLLNTIVSGNNATIANADIQGAISSSGYNLVGDTTGAAGLLGSDITGVSALLDPLSDNGGYVQTHALMTGSLAINAGAISGTPTVDARGVTRDGATDIGAYEAASTTFVVTTTADSGAGSLRQAIIDANSLAGADVIEFNISGTGVHVITPLSALPTITDTVTIDATSDDSYAANGNRPAIVLAGTSAGAGTDAFVLSSTADGSVIRGLVIQDWGGDGIEIQLGSDHNRIVGNYIGRLNTSGTDSGAGTGNDGNGILIYGASNHIGGATLEDRNVISGNATNGIQISGSSATGNDALGNYIGVTAAGNVALGNGNTGVLINANATLNQIGSAGFGNVISGNVNGVQIFDGGTMNNVVLGNYIGVDSTATITVGNTSQGVQIGGGAANNVIGGDLSTDANVISGNGTSAVEITGSGTSGNEVRGNYIGTNSGGILDLGNGIHGIRIQDNAMDNVIGGTGVGNGNVIAFNTTHGVSIVGGASGNAVMGNAIYGSGEIGIDINDDSVTPNDIDDVDSGTNGLLNFPVISSVVQNGADLDITFGADLASGTFRIEFFENPSGIDASGHGEGQIYLGTATIVSTGAAGIESFTATLSGVTATSIVGVTATATEDRGGGYFGNTSEFSTAFTTAAEFINTGEIRVNETTTNTQETSGETRGSQKAVAISANGDYVVVWSSDSQDGSGWGVYAQKFNSSGTALSGEILVSQTTTNDQMGARVGAADDGSFVVTWSWDAAGDPQAVMARRFAADGSAIDDEFIVNSTVAGKQSNSSIAVNASGQFIITWEGPGIGDTDGIYYRRFNADGTSIDAVEVRANVDDLGAENTPDVAMNDVGQFAIAWEAAGEIYVRHYDVDGLMVATATHNDLMVDETSSNAYGPSIAMDASGRTVVAYRTPGIATVGAGIWVKAFDLSGVVRHSYFSPSTGVGINSTSPSVDADDYGNFIIVYHGSTNSDGDGDSVKYQIYDADANEVSAETQVNVSTDGDQQLASVAMLDANNFVVVWSGEGDQSGQEDTSGVFARQFHFEPADVDLDADDSSGATGRDYDTTFVAEGGAVAIVDSDGTITQGDDANIDSLIVTIEDLQDGTDEVLAAVTTGTSITASYADGILTLSGTDTVAHYQQVLRTITYNNSASSPTAGSRTITYFARAGASLSGIATTHLTVTVPPNVAPTADAGGAYTIYEGGSVNLDASGSSDSDGTITTYMWDLDNDGDFEGANDLTTASSSLTVTWSELVAAGINEGGAEAGGGTDYTVGLRITDDDGDVTDVTTTITVNDVAPTLVVSGDATTESGATYTLNLATVDPGNDTISSWTINWGDGTIEDVGAVASVTHVYNAVGFTHNILVSATDADGTYLQNELLVTNYAGDSIYRFSATSGNFIEAFADGDGIDAPVGLVIGPDGALYLSGDSSKDVLRYNAETGAFIDTFVSSGASGLSDAEGIAFGPDGNLYVADYGGKRVMRFDGNTGAYIDDFVAASSGGLNKPYGLLFGPDGNLYVNSYTEDNVLRFDGVTGAFIDTFVSAESGGLDTPEQMVFGPDGNLYIASSNTDEVLRYDGTTGAFIDAFVTAQLGGLDRPTGLTFGPDGNLYVADYEDGAVLRYDGSSGAFIDEYVAAGAGSFDTPAFMNFLPKHQVTVVANTAVGAVSDTNVSANEVAEDAIVGASVGITAFADDVDGETVSYSLDDDAGGLFQINASSGVVTVKSTLNYEANTSHDIVVRATSADTTFSTAGFTINVTDVNDVAPTVDAAQAFNVNENASNTTSLGYVAATDPDTVGALTNWVITAGNNDGIFAINSGTGELTILDNANLDRESSSSYTLTVRVEDGVNTSTTETISVTVNDVNDVAPVIAASQTFNVDEDAANNVSLGTVVATDSDSVGTLGNWTITAGNDDGVFSINTTTGELTVADNTNLDRESAASYTLSIRVDDGTNTSATETISITIDDVNDNTPIITSSQSFSVDEDAANTTSLGTVVASDPDSSGSLRNWAIMAGNDDGVFAIDASSGELTVVDNSNLDFESVENYTLTIQVEDGLNTSTTETISISVNDLNDNAPVIAGAQTFSVDENAADATSLGTVVASDADTVGGLTNWAITSGNDDGVFAIDASTGELTVTDNTNLDFESTGSYTLSIEVQDGTNTSSTQTVTVSVNDINESPTITLTPVVTTIDENADTSSAITVATITVNDDGLGTETLTLSGADEGMFEIDGNNLRLKAGVTLDFESNASLDVTVSVDDASIPGTPDDSQSHTITVQDRNDPATGDAVISGTNVEGETLSVDVSSIADEDGLGPFTYQWTRDGVAIGGANAATYVIDTDDIGSVIRVEVSFTDGGVNGETIVSAPTATIVAANVAPTLSDYQTAGTTGQPKVVPASVFESLADDLDGDSLTAILVTPPSSGTVTVMPSGLFTFTPAPGFVGQVTFEWMANDGLVNSNVATVTLEFTPVIPPPTPKSTAAAEGDAGSDSSEKANEEPAESDTSESESESTSEDDSSTESSDSESNDAVQSGVRGETKAESRSEQGSESTNVVEVAIESQATTQNKQVSPTDALIKQLSESFTTQTTRTSRVSGGQGPDSSGPLSDYQTRNLVMADFALMTRPGAMWDQLDNYQKDVDSRIQGDLIVVGSAGAAASSFTVGVVAWALRSGFLVSGLIAHMPAWSGVDPLLIMNGLSGGSAAGAAGSETLEQLMDRQNKEVEQSDHATPPS